jgi:hypothetical protein
LTTDGHGFSCGLPRASCTNDAWAPGASTASSKRGSGQYGPTTTVRRSVVVDATIERACEVHVTFTAEGERRTLVELEHRHLGRHGDGWQAMREAVGSPKGWDLHPYAKAISQAA